MNLNTLSDTIEIELHNNKCISQTTKENIDSVIERQTAIRGGLKLPFDPSKLKGLDRAILNTLNKKLDKIDPRVRDIVMQEIASKGQSLLPENANIYYTKLATDAETLKNVVNETLTDIQKIQGGRLNLLIVKILSAISLVLIITVIYCAVKYASNGSPKETVDNGAGK